MIIADRADGSRVMDLRKSTPFADRDRAIPFGTRSKTPGGRRFADVEMGIRSRRGLLGDLIYASTGKFRARLISSEKGPKP
jgi:hypothetical protein